MARDKIDWGRAAWELAEENTRLKAENQTMREALKYVAERDDPGTGAVAREVLAKLKGEKKEPTP